MSDLTIRPTAKFIMFRAVVAIVVFLILEYAWYTRYRDDERLTFLPFLAVVVLIHCCAPGALQSVPVQ